MKPFTFCLLLLPLLAASSCATKTDPKPAQISDLDVLLQSSGYWEWQSSASRGSQLTPSSVRFNRELIFKTDGLVHIYHNRQPFLQPAFQLSTGALKLCGAPPQPTNALLVRYTAESQIPNDDLRAYSIRLSSTDTTLRIQGESACVDGGRFETYRWHRH